MTEALWPYALDVYGRDGVEEVLLELQDAHGQCVPFLLWALWMTAGGRVPDEGSVRGAAELARAWQDAAVEPLRRIRRSLKGPVVAAPGPAKERLRQGVQTLELEAERMLLQMLEDASPAATGQVSAKAALQRAAAVWGGDPPERLIARLATLAG